MKQKSRLTMSFTKQLNNNGNIYQLKIQTNFVTTKLIRPKDNDKHLFKELQGQGLGITKIFFKKGMKKRKKGKKKKKVIIQTI